MAASVNRATEAASRTGLTIVMHSVMKIVTKIVVKIDSKPHGAALVPGGEEGRGPSRDSR